MSTLCRRTDAIGAGRPPERGLSSFDRLVENYDLEKIKTIGDCYMVAILAAMGENSTTSAKRMLAAMYCSAIVRGFHVESQIDERARAAGVPRARSDHVAFQCPAVSLGRVRHCFA